MRYQYRNRKDELAQFAAAADAVYPSDPRTVRPSPPEQQPDPKLIDLLIGVARVSAQRQFIARKERCGRVQGSLVLLNTAEPFVIEAKAIVHLLAHAYDAAVRPRTRRQWRDREVVATCVGVLAYKTLGLAVDEVDLANFGFWGGHSDRLDELSQRILVAYIELEMAVLNLTAELSGGEA